MATIERTKTVKTDRRHLKVVGVAGVGSSIAINGQIVAVNSIIEVSLHEAVDLIGRRLAVDATAAEVTAAGANVIIAPSRNDKWRDAA